MHHLEVTGARVKDYVTAVVLSMWLPHNYSITVARKKSWKVERSRWWSIGLWAPYKGWPLHMTLYSMTFNHSMTVSFVLYIFEHQLKAFPGSFEEIDLVMEWWERHRIAIYTLRSTIFFHSLGKNGALSILSSHLSPVSKFLSLSFSFYFSHTLM